LENILNIYGFSPPLKVKRMKAHVNFNNYQNVDVTMTITMRYEEWQFIREQIRSCPGSYDFLKLIDESLSKLSEKVVNTAAFDNDEGRHLLHEVSHSQRETE
jgi:hypothetical protein